jgi:lipid II:glycine glycyltransferase (peptidoglycan interpeptide bridge formation enzyme)
MKFQILTKKDQSIWQKLVNRLDDKKRDLHFLPEYAEIYEKTYGHIPHLAFYGDENRYIIQPFVKRELNDLPFLKEQEVKEKFYDIANPYGYGGPLNFGKPDVAVVRQFEKNFSIFMKKEKIASEFCSFHPLLKNHLLLKGIVPIQKQKEIVYIDLTQDQDDLWHDISKGHRSDISKARRNKVEVRKVPLSKINFAIFNRMYYASMKRHGAAERWFFPKNYFQDCAKYLGEKRVSLFFTYAKGKIASANLLIHDFDLSYHHFGASDPKYYLLRTNSLSMWEMICFAQKASYKYFHLGGGVTNAADDSLLRFKEGFSELKKPLYTYFRIHHLPTYSLLIKLKKEYEIKTLGKEIKSCYLPVYRREI